MTAQKILEFLKVDPMNVARTALLVVATVLVALVVHKLLIKALGKFEELLVESKLKSHRPAQAQRVKTVVGLIRQVEVVCVTLFTFVLVLDEVGLDIRPILAGAGVVGLAVGFGAQSLVKDFFTGLCLILENQITVGDWVTINGHSGAVEVLNFRITVLRDAEGAVHVIPNGSISAVTNFTHTWSASVLDVPVPQGQTLSQTSDLMTRIYEEMAQDEKWKELVESFELLGVQDLTDRGALVRGRLRTVPGSQWSAAREFRQRLSLGWESIGVDPPRTTQNRVVKDTPPGLPSPE